MKKSVQKFVLFLAVVFLAVACNKNDSIINPDEQGTLQQALLKITDSSQVIQSFEPNYDEETAMNFALGKVNTQIYPVRVGQRMHLISRNLEVNIQGDTAYGVLRRTFEGRLFIAASYDQFTVGDSSAIDTVITKDFTTTITRNILFEKFNNTKNPERNWRIIAVSLPHGGTMTENAKIKSVTVYLPGGDTLNVTDPNNTYINMNFGFGHGGMHHHMGGMMDFPQFGRNKAVKVKVEVQSAYADTDFVTLTYGALMHNKMQRAKVKFRLVSESQENGYYVRVFEQTYKTRAYPGWKHAVINLLPRGVVFDDSQSVEEDSWGIPYKVE